MPSNNFLPFAPNDTGTNLLTQSAYAAASDRTNGNQPGVASSKLVNKAIRQSAYIASQYAQFISDTLGADVLDDAVPAELLAQINAVFKLQSPIITQFTTGSGNWNKTYVFKIASGSATSGATYTNNAITFTVKATVSGAIEVLMTGSGAPSVSGILTKATGTGDATLTFYAVKSALYLRVRAVGGGGGTAGGGGTPGAGTDGSATTFGSSLVTANGGAKGTVAVSGAGGSSTIGAGGSGIALTGSKGNTPAQYGSSLVGGMGGNSPFGGAGVDVIGTGGTTATANTGSGGGGGGSTNTSLGASAGGGSGGYIDAIISSPASTYAYAIGAGGTGGAAGTSGETGGAGAAGIVIIEECFQ